MNISIVRPMTADDLPKLCQLLVDEVWKRMDYPREGLSHGYFISLWESLILRGLSMSYIAEQDGEITSFLLGLQGNDPYSGRPIAYEQFWYARIGKGGKDALRLITAFMADAVRRKCARVFTGDWQPRDGVDLSKVYKRYGLEPLERYYIKEL